MDSCSWSKSPCTFWASHSSSSHWIFRTCRLEKPCRQKGQFRFRSTHCFAHSEHSECAQDSTIILSQVSRQIRHSSVVGLSLSLVPCLAISSMSTYLKSKISIRTNGPRDVTIGSLFGSSIDTRTCEKCKVFIWLWCELEAWDVVLFTFFLKQNSSPAPDLHSRRKKQLYLSMVKKLMYRPHRPFRLRQREWTGPHQQSQGACDHFHFAAESSPAADRAETTGRHPVSNRSAPPNRMVSVYRKEVCVLPRSRSYALRDAAWKNSGSPCFRVFFWFVALTGVPAFLDLNVPLLTSLSLNRDSRFWGFWSKLYLHC